MTIVFKPSENIKKKIIEYYKDLKKKKTPPYAIFQAVEADTVITLYESGKVMFQGISADIDANIWIDLERSLNNRIINIEEKENKKEKNKKLLTISSIGSDEVGTGDFFGPIVVCACYINKSQTDLLLNLGIKDSKKISDEKIIKLAPQIIKLVPYSCFILDNKTYNSQYNSEFNMNKIKAILHNKVITTLLKKDNFVFDKIVIDQFVYPKKYFEHLKDQKEITKNITFLTHAEDQVLSVACSSIISRYIFLKELKKISDELSIEIPKGAGPKVDEIGYQIVQKYGLNKLKEIAKLNFKNLDKIKNYSTHE